MKKHRPITLLAFVFAFTILGLTPMARALLIDLVANTNPTPENINGKRYVLIKKGEQVSFKATTDPTVYYLSWSFENGSPSSGSANGPHSVTYGNSSEGNENVVKFTIKRRDSAGTVCKTENKRTCAVIVPKFITPAGDPVASPKDTGDGQNEFTFNNAANGELTMNLKATLPGGIASNIVNDLKFEVDPVGTSTIEWDTANANGKPTASGDTITALVKFKDLPAQNSSFGKKKARLKFKNRVVAEADYEVFYTRDATNHPGGQNNSPNWFHYWSQVIPGHDLFYGGAGTGAGAEVKGMTNWGYAAAPNKTQITLYEPTKEKYKSYNVGKEFSGIDRFIGTIKHEAKHVDQIARADALLSTNGSDSFRHGWSWNVSTHNHWTKGADAKWGVANTDDDADNTVDNAKTMPPFEPGNGDDVSLDNTTWVWWPQTWALPNPNNGPHPIESEAINYSDQNHDEHKNARDDWGHPGKNHKTQDKYDD